MIPFNRLESFAHTLAQESGDIIRSYFRTKVAVNTKADQSPVTIADRTAESCMRELITKEFPEHGILGEEFGTINPGAEYLWILDPIDGTKSFICGAHTFGTLIALLKNGEPILGVIHQPITREFLIGNNETSRLNGEPVQMRECKSLSEAVLLTTDYLNVEKYRDIKTFDRLIRNVKLYRQWGDCYGYLLAAAGYADIMIDPIMHVWDFMALIPIIRGAGGVITDYYGNDALKGESTIATTKELLPQVLEMLHNRNALTEPL